MMKFALALFLLATASACSFRAAVSSSPESAASTAEAVSSSVAASSAETSASISSAASSVETSSAASGISSAAASSASSASANASSASSGATSSLASLSSVDSSAVPSAASSAAPSSAQGESSSVAASLSAQASSLTVSTNYAYTNDTALIDIYNASSNLPAVAFLSPAAGESIFGSFVIRFTATRVGTNVSSSLTLRGSNLALVYEASVVTNGLTVETWSAALNTFELPDGWYPAIAIVIDTAGRAATNAMTISVDNAARVAATYPFSQVTNLAAGSYVTNAAFTFRGKASIQSGLITNVSLTVSNALFVTNLRLSTNAAAFGWAFPLDLAPFGEGPVSVLAAAWSFSPSATFTNSTNNSETAAWTVFTNDQTPPVVAFDSAPYETNLRRSFWTLDTTATDDGSGIANVYTELSNSAGVFPNILPGEGTALFHFSDTFPLARGANLLRVTATDRAGRQSGVLEKSLVAGDAIPMNDAYNDFVLSSDRLGADSGKYDYLTWDADYLYIGFGPEDMKTNIKAFFVAIGTNEADGTNWVPWEISNVGSSVWLGHPARFAYVFRGTNGDIPSCGKLAWNGTAWASSAGTYLADASSEATGFVSSTFGKYRISRAALGNPSRVYLSTWARDLSANGGWGWYFGAGPADEDGSTTAWDGFDDRWQPRWVDLDLASSVAPNDPSHLKSAKPPHTILLDGVSDFFPQTENAAANDGKTNSVTWDDNFLYLGFRSEAMNANNKAFYVAVSTDSNAGARATPFLQWETGSAVNTALPVQHFFSFKWSNGMHLYHSSWSGSAWDSPTQDGSADMAEYSGPVYNEYRISRAALGSPAGKIWISSWEKNLTNAANVGWGWMFGAFPSDSWPESSGINDRYLNTMLEIDLSQPARPNRCRVITNDSMPPLLSIATLSLAAPSGLYTLSGAAIDRLSGVAGVSCSLNGSAFGPVPLADSNFSTNLALASGTNTILVYAADSDGNFTATNSNTVYAAWHTVAVDGVNDFWPSSEKFTAGDGKYGYFSWDSANLYFGFESEDFTVDNKTFYVAISTNTNYGATALPYAPWFEGSTVNLPAKAQFLFYFKRWSGTEEKYRRTWDGSVWSNANDATGLSSYCTSSYNEFRIGKSEIGNPSRIWVAFWAKNLAFDGSGYGYFFGDCPDGSATGETGDKTLTKWIEVNLGEGVIPNDPAHLKP